MITIIYILVNKVEHGDEQDLFKMDILHFEQNLTLSEVQETFVAIMLLIFSIGMGSLILVLLSSGIYVPEKGL